MFFIIDFFDSQCCKISNKQSKIGHVDCLLFIVDV